MNDNTTCKDSGIVVKWVFIFSLIISIFGFFFTSVLSQESRITRVETKVESTSKDIAEIKDGIREIRAMQTDLLRGTK